MADAWTNPMGTDGFEFLEFAAPEPARLDRLFRSLGFSPAACLRSKDVTLYRQGAINLILNAEPASFAQSYGRVHGPSICAVGLRVRNAPTAAERAQRLGAEVVPPAAGPMELNIPAIRGIGGSLFYLIDRYEGSAGTASIYDIDFVPLPGAESHPPGLGLRRIHALEFGVHAGRRGIWTDFLARLFNFREQADGLLAPCGQIRLILQETAAAPTGAGFPDAYRDEGIRRVLFAAGGPGELSTDNALGPTSFATVGDAA